MYSDKTADGSLNKTVLRSSKRVDPRKNQKFMNYVLNERKSSN